MRILTVTHFFESHGGGIELVAGQLNRRFTATGHETSWAAADEDSLPGADAAAAVPMPCNNLLERMTGLPMPLPGPTGLRRLAAEIRASDAVVVHDALYASSIAALLIARWHRRPVLLVQHIAAIPFSNRVLRAVMRLANLLVTRPMLRAADHVAFISATVRSAFADVRFARAPMLVFNGVDRVVFHPGRPGERVETRASLGISEDARLLLFVGRFVEKKGLEIIRRVAASRPDWQFALAGRGPIDPARWNLPNVRVLAGLSGESLAALYRAADVLVLPSVGEGFPLVVQEAMACGLPVVCGAETSRADPQAGAWLRGVAVDLSDPPGSAERTIAAIETIDDGSPDRAAMSAYARATYDWDVMARQIVAALAERVHSRQGITRQRADRAASSSAT